MQEDAKTPDYQKAPGQQAYGEYPLINILNTYLYHKLPSEIREMTLSTLTRVQ